MLTFLKTCKVMAVVLQLNSGQVSTCQNAAQYYERLKMNQEYQVSKACNIAWTLIEDKTEKIVLKRYKIKDQFEFCTKLRDNYKKKQKSEVKL